MQPQQAWERRRDADSRTGVRRLGRTEMQSETTTSSAAPGNPVAQSKAIPRPRVAGTASGERRAAHGSDSDSDSDSVGGCECEQRDYGAGAGAGAIVGKRGRQRWLRLNLNAGGTVGTGVCARAAVELRMRWGRRGDKQRGRGWTQQQPRQREAAEAQGLAGRGAALKVEVEVRMRGSRCQREQRHTRGWPLSSIGRTTGLRRAEGQRKGRWQVAGGDQGVQS